MSPDLYFALTLIVKMAVTAAFLLAATVTAERAGTLIGGMVATLPISAGPVYVFLALDHDAHFIAESAVASLSINGVNIVFAFTYALLAQKRSMSVSLLGALAVWLALVLTVRSFDWNFAAAALFNVVVIIIGLWVARPLRHAPMPRVHARWQDLVLRAAMVAALVGVVVAFSFQLGPGGSGILAVAPIVLTSIVLILHRRVGGPATAAILANGVRGLAGFAIALSALHFTAEPFGVAAGLVLALAISGGWGLLMVRRRTVAV